MSTRQKIHKLRKEIDLIREQDFEKIVSFILKALKEYQNNAMSWDNLYFEIEDLFYKFFEGVYKSMNIGLEGIYKQLKEFSVEDISDLTYHLDGKTIEERLKEYWNESKKRLDNKENPEDVKTYLINKYDRILNTETRVIESRVKNYRKPLNAAMLIIEHSSGCPDCPGGEYAADENVDLPPFHPNCQCCYYYVVTDDEDDINDLDLEVDELA